MRSVTGPKRPWFTAGALLALVGAAGCGNQYRPVVTPVRPTGPASQPIAYVVAFSQPNLTQLAAGAANPCPNTSTSSQSGVVTLIDFSGDTIMAQANVGIGPQTFALDPSGTSAYSANCDGTLSTAPISTTLQTKNILTTTLPTGPSTGSVTYPTNILVTSTGEYVTEPHPQDLQTTNQSAVGALTNNTSGVPSVKQEIPVAPSLINLVGTASSQRVYAISQGNSTTGTGVTWGQCDSPTSVPTNGEVDGIETSTLTVSSQLAVGKCPVYGLMSPDGRRVFTMNRGSGTISVIDSVKNQLDTSVTSYLTGNATIQCNPGTTVCIGAGPVYADYYAPSALLVTANYDDDSISIIDTSINNSVLGFTDTPNFGHILATVKVGHHPAAVTVLQDGSRAYVANEGDLGDGGSGSVTIVNLSSFTVEGTLPVNGHPRSIASTFNAPIGKVYTIAQDSPYMTVIRTDTNIVSASILLQGNGVDLHTTTQYAGTSGTTANAITQSRSIGSGAP